ncbi:hypothetical protein HYH02_005738 [Chlamydomonas schloesseri]|uniref:PDZ domain-containing protein n=1 Tax=Chlamydomonas schloesseri TaxID=2026947 RepID=A0A835WKL4_9CHLO|nr:hypothetical protein HYH02_005738 [Chlamydomonas schloesseri]|eukprot:KAG2448984.1 hypothetical protein HYH02_005738 [Chlamydomonas schloesseri]
MSVLAAKPLNVAVPSGAVRSAPMVLRPVASARAERAAVACASSVALKAVSRRQVLCQAQTGTKPAQAATSEAEYYELDLPKPLGFKFARGNDGGAYIIDVNPKAGNVDPRVQPGDKIVEISASFGSEVWKAENFGQIMYAIRTRSGTVYMKLKKNYGDLSALEEEGLDAAEKQWKKERAGGNYGAGTKEIQARNYVQRKENERKRREMFDDALAKFKENDIQGALVEFENIIAMEPRNYVGDNFSRNTPIYKVTQYNIACCYSMLDQVEEAIKSLDAAMLSGFDNYDQIRRDKNLVKARASPKFQAVLDKYDEPVVNWNAVKATFGAFGNMFNKEK